MKSLVPRDSRRYAAKKKIAGAVAFLLLTTSCLYALSLEVRKEYIQQHLDGHIAYSPGHQWLTSHAILFANNWRAEGPAALRFGLVYNPASVEFPSVQSREVYPSYPPGAVIPIYLLTQITGHKAGVAMVVAYNLVSQFLIVLFLSLTLLFFLLRLRFGIINAAALAATPPVIALFTPQAMYFHTSVYLFEQAVLLPFVLYLFLETVRESAGGARSVRAIAALQALVLFYGVLTEYLMLFAAAAVWVARLCRKQCGKSPGSVIKSSAVFWAPCVLAAGMFVVQSYVLDFRHRLDEKFELRTFTPAPWGDDLPYYFWQHVFSGYGSTGLLTAWGGLSVLLGAMALSFVPRPSRIKRMPPNGVDELKDTLALMSCFLLPCFLMAFLFQNHHTHSFTALKFSIPHAVIPVLVPIAIIYAAERLVCLGARIASREFGGIKPEWERRWRMYLPVLLLPAVFFYVPQWDSSTLTKFFPAVRHEMKHVGDFIAENTGYSDVVFSPVFSVPELPPQQLALTMKRVYRVAGIDQIKRKVEGIKEPFTVNIFLNAGRDLHRTPLRQLTLLQPRIIRKGEYALYKIEGRRFLQNF